MEFGLQLLIFCVCVCVCVCACLCILCLYFSEHLYINSILERRKSLSFLVYMSLELGGCADMPVSHGKHASVFASACFLVCESVCACACVCMPVCVYNVWERVRGWNLTTCDSWWAVANGEG